MPADFGVPISQAVFWSRRCLQEAWIDSIIYIAAGLECFSIKMLLKPWDPLCTLVSNKNSCLVADCKQVVLRG